MAAQPAGMSQLSETASFLRERLTRAPSVLLVLGSGLGAIADGLLDPVRIPYSEIPGFPRSTVPGHSGALLAGIWEGVEVAAMQGRFHLYEGWPAEAVALPLRVITNSSGGIRWDLAPGDLMLIADHLNFMFRNPLVGPVATGEERFPDMSNPYDSTLQEIAMSVAAEMQIPLTRGVFAAMLGPTYETPAEVEMLRRLGADAVGMSTVPEVVVARALGMRVLGISCIANAAAARGGPRLTHEDVLVAGAAAAERLALLLKAVIPRAIAPNLPTEAAS
jgi:purine-nucleoside phosphorylase